MKPQLKALPDAFEEARYYWHENQQRSWFFASFFFVVQVLYLTAYYEEHLEPSIQNQVIDALRPVAFYLHRRAYDGELE